MTDQPRKPSSCFLHVPKSGGTALTLYLRATLGKRNVFHVGEGRYQKASSLEGLLKRYPVITGHFNVAQMPERLFQATFLFTFLREPADRIVSMYHFYKEGDVDSDRRVVIGEEWSLAGALDKWAVPGRCSAWSNEQTLLFSGATDADQPAEALLPLALRNLERFDFVGIHEQFAEGVECLGRLRGWPLHAPVPRFKASRKRPPVEEVEPALVERILAVNHCDVQLYARARELWESARTRARGLPVVVAPPVEPASRVPDEGAAATFPDRAATLPDSQSVDSSLDAPLQRTEKGSQEIRFSSVDVFDLRTGGDAVVQQGNPAEVRLGVYSTLDAVDINVGLLISDEADLEVYGINTQMQGRVLRVEAGTITVLSFVFDMTLAPGAYYLTVAIQGGDSHDGKLFHWIDNVSFFWCVHEQPPGFVGLVDLQARLKVANPYLVGGSSWWRPPRPVRLLQRTITKKLGLPWRPPKLVRYIVRTIKNEKWHAIRYFLSGKPPQKRDGEP